jgi:hypothetical protein
MNGPPFLKNENFHGSKTAILILVTVDKEVLAMSDLEDASSNHR